MSAPVYSFPWVISPLSFEEFENEYFEKRFVHLKRNDREYFSPALSYAAIERYLYNETLKFPSTRLTNAKEDVPTEKYVQGEKVVASNLLKHFVEGSTIVLSGLHEHVAGLGELVSNLSKQFYQRFQTNIYITPKGSQGFKVHYDTHDVFVLQIHGKKTWKIYKDNPVSLPNKLMEFAPGKYAVGEVEETIVAEAGDLIYIPRGVMHQAETNDEMSIHVTLGMLGYTWTDLLIESVLEFSKTDDSLRKFLPRDMLRNGVKENHLAYFSELFSTMSTAISLQESVNRFKREISASQKINIKNLLTQGDSVSEIGDDSIFEVRQNVLFLIKRKGENVVLEWQGKEVEFPMFMDPAIHFIAKIKEPFGLAHVPDCVDHDGKIVFVTRLIKEGLLSIKIN